MALDKKWVDKITVRCYPVRKYRHDYTVCRNNSPEIFKEACKTISDFIPYAVKNKLLIDVDGSTIQVFENCDAEIVVYDDYDVGAVYILSDINLDSLFKQYKTQRIE